jgi:hypothetical protein
MLKNVGAMDPFGGALDGSLSKWNHLHEEKSRVRVKETGHCGRIEAINAHGGHVVRLDSGHTIEATDDELEPEDWHGHRSRPTPSSKSRTVDFAKTMLSKFDGLRTADVSERDRVLIDSAIRQVEDGAFANATNPFAGLDDTDADPPPITLLKIIQSKYETSSGGGHVRKSGGRRPGRAAHRADHRRAACREERHHAAGMPHRIRARAIPAGVGYERSDLLRRLKSCTNRKEK